MNWKKLVVLALLIFLVFSMAACPEDGTGRKSRPTSTPFDTFGNFPSGDEFLDVDMEILIKHETEEGRSK